MCYYLLILKRHLIPWNGNCYLCLEILGDAIRNCDQIKGICVLDEECKISQYADDTTLILDGSEKSVQ